MRATSRHGWILAAVSRPATRGTRDMGRRHPNHRLIKIHRTYTVEEAANRLGLHKNTMWRWTKQGLPVIDKRRPKLIHGEALVQFLIERQMKSKQPCQTGQIYCVGCRAPKRPNGDMADYVRWSRGAGNLRGLCPDCDRFIYRRVSLAALDEVRGHLDVTVTQA
jgi:excisionase family DNA binding protein